QLAIDLADVNTGEAEHVHHVLRVVFERRARQLPHLFVACRPSEDDTHVAKRVLALVLPQEKRNATNKGRNEIREPEGDPTREGGAESVGPVNHGWSCILGVVPNARYWEAALQAKRPPAVCQGTVTSRRIERRTGMRRAPCRICSRRPAR